MKKSKKSDDADIETKKDKELEKRQGALAKGNSKDAKTKKTKKSHKPKKDDKTEKKSANEDDAKLIQKTTERETAKPEKEPKSKDEEKSKTTKSTKSSKPKVVVEMDKIVSEAKSKSGPSKAADERNEKIKKSQLHKVSVEKFASEENDRSESEDINKSAPVKVDETQKKIKKVKKPKKSSKVKTERKIVPEKVKTTGPKKGEGAGDSENVAEGKEDLVLEFANCKVSCINE